MKEPLIISGCLLGLACRYDGKTKPLPEDILYKLRQSYSLIAVCPEQLGGLATPRDAAEFNGNGFFTRDNTDVTTAYQKGAAETLKLAHFFGASRALLKEKSPACGFGKIYDGTFTKTLTDGNGAAAHLLHQHGISVYGEHNIDELL